MLKDENLSKSKSAVAGLEGMKIFLQYCDLYGVKDKVVFDLSLARGLDYYTGVIFEAVLLSKNLIEFFLKPMNFNPAATIIWSGKKKKKKFDFRFRSIGGR